MKKTLRINRNKVTLSRETIRHLRELPQVLGQGTVVRIELSPGSTDPECSFMGITCTHPN